MPKPSKDSSVRTFVVKVHPTLYTAVAVAAKLAGLTLSAYIGKDRKSVV